MKRLSLFSIILTIIVFSFSSCSKCVTCNFGGGDIRQYCSKDFPDGTKGLNLTVKYYEQSGYTCN